MLNLPVTNRGTADVNGLIPQVVVRYAMLEYGEGDVYAPFSIENLAGIELLCIPQSQGPTWIRKVVILRGLNWGETRITQYTGCGAG